MIDSGGTIVAPTNVPVSQILSTNNIMPKTPPIRIGTVPLRYTNPVIAHAQRLPMAYPEYVVGNYRWIMDQADLYLTNYAYCAYDAAPVVRVPMNHVAHFQARTVVSNNLDAFYGVAVIPANKAGTLKLMAGLRVWDPAVSGGSVLTGAVIYASDALPSCGKSYLIYSPSALQSLFGGDFLFASSNVVNIGQSQWPAQSIHTRRINSSGEDVTLGGTVTLENPLVLPAPGTAALHAATVGQLAGTGAVAVAHIVRTDNPHGVTAAQVGSPTYAQANTSNAADRAYAAQVAALSTQTIFRVAVSNAVRQILADMRYSWTPAASNTTQIGTAAKPIASIYATDAHLSTGSLHFADAVMSAPVGTGKIVINGTGIVAFAQDVSAAVNTATNSGNLKNLGSGLSIVGGQLTASGGVEVGDSAVWLCYSNITLSSSTRTWINGYWYNTNAVTSAWGEKVVGYDSGTLLDKPTSTTARYIGRFRAPGDYGFLFRYFSSGLAAGKFLEFYPGTCSVGGSVTNLIGQRFDLMATTDGLPREIGGTVRVLGTNTLLLAYVIQDDTDGGSEMITSAYGRSAIYLWRIK
jgi:hypothetical protein